MIKLSKVANIEDFNDINISQVLKKYRLYNLPEHVWENIDSIKKYDERLLNKKTWEFAMVLLAFDSMNMLSGDKEILGIGVAKEEMIPIISNYCRRLFATDMYLDSGPWDEWSNLDMLKNPRLQFGDRLNFKKVVFQHVDGRDLPYEDNSFDAIFSCSSIEHFGNESDIRKSIQEIHRVLKPNGVAALSTEYKISGVDQLDNLQLFDKNRLFKIFIEGVNWKSLDFLDEIYCMTNPIDFRKSILDKKYFNETYPQIIFKFKNNVWTSVHLTLIKD